MPDEFWFSLSTHPGSRRARSGVSVPPASPQARGEVGALLYSFLYSFLYYLFVWVHLLHYPRAPLALPLVNLLHQSDEYLSLVNLLHQLEYIH